MSFILPEKQFTVSEGVLKWNFSAGTEDCMLKFYFSTPSGC
ncbi:Uncharacterized protein dnm_088900 [Desulfonema magnum]|uniref:Uncharacterized protein n=1 Tax=Desulfonema magnum TaxID=45655 RepID=A0A975BW78_9BACT|nr:Uncharacterized protein dnm_088900 [Desulfonema magnum]